MYIQLFFLVFLLELISFFIFLFVLNYEGYEKNVLLYCIVRNIAILRLC